jgi:hypothetical protein
MENRNTALILTLCPQEESILLNDEILDILGRPQQVHIMINDEQRRLLLQACSPKDWGAVVVPGEKVVQFPISGRSLLKHIRKIIGWTDHQARVIEGTYIEEHNAILFDLHSAVPVIIESIETDEPQ